jgi:hypothetical protein
MLRSKVWGIILLVVADVRTSNPVASSLFAGYKKYWLEVTFWPLQKRISARLAQEQNFKVGNVLRVITG